MKPHKIFLTAIFIGISFLYSTAQNIQGIVNSYTPVTSINYATATVTVGSSTDFTVGDRVLLIQMQGADINTTQTPAFGDIAAYNNAGNYEFANVAAINGNNIVLTPGICRGYTPGRGVQLIRVPVYTKPVFIINTLTCQPWNGTTGGVLAFEATAQVNFQSNINVDGMGFRGGRSRAIVDRFFCNDFNFGNPLATNQGGEKGEGIAGYVPGFQLARGKNANGGGGAQQGNSGAGGGGNITAGGMGGDQVMAAGQCTTTSNGVGGTALDYTPNKLFLGGGGGGGYADNGRPVTDGTNGGGMVFITAPTIAGNGAAISANGIAQTVITNDEGAGAGGAAGTIVLNVNTYVNTSTLVLNANGGNGGNTFNNQFPRLCHGPGGGGSGGAIVSNITLPGNVVTLLAGGLAGRVQNPASGSCFNTSSGATNGTAGRIVSLNPNRLVIQIQQNPALVCLGNVFTLTATGGAPNSTYTWTGPDIANNGTATVIVRPSTPGTKVYTVTVASAGIAGCIATAQITVNVNPTPSIRLTASNLSCGTGNLCANIFPNQTGGSFTWTSTIPNSFTVNPNACGTPVQCNAIAWNTNITYLGDGGLGAGNGELVSFNGRLYRALWWSRGSQPDLFTWCWPSGCPGGINMWLDLGPCTNGTPTGQQIDITQAATYSVFYTAESGCRTAVLNRVIDIPTIDFSVTSSANSVCVGQSVTLTATPIRPLAGWTFNWTGPGLSSTTAATVSAVVNGISTYTVSGSAAGLTCPPITRTVRIGITAPVIIAATANPAFVCPGNATTLTVTSPVPGAVYTWTGGGINLTGTSVSVIPSSPTTYTVSATNSGAVCLDPATVTVGINIPPVVTIAGNNAICDRGTLCATATPSQGGGNFTWTSTSPFTLNPNNCGANNCTAPAWDPATIYLGDATRGAGMGEIILFNGRQYRALWWTRGEQPDQHIQNNGNGQVWVDLGACTTASQIDITSQGNYTVIYRNARGCPSAPVTQQVIQRSFITTAIASPSFICVGSNTTLTASGGSPTAVYTWTGGGINTTGATIQVSPNQTTTYTVSGVEQGSGCPPTTATVTVTVHPAVTIYTGNTGFCPVQDPVDILLKTNTYANLTGPWVGASVIYTWTPDSWVPATIGQPSGAIAGSGTAMMQTLPNQGVLTYSLTATATNSNGTCTSPPTNLKLSLLCPTPVFFISQSGQLSGSNVIVRWQVGATGSNNGGQFYVEQSIDDMASIWTTKGIVNYSITPGGSFSYTVTNVPRTRLYYRIRFVDVDGNSTSSRIFVVYNTARESADAETAAAYTVAPNPASEYFTLNTTNIGVGIVTVRNTLGEIVYTTEVNDEVLCYTFGQEFASGMYYITIASDSYTDTRKLVKE